MKTIDLKCKNCGATMELSEDRTKATCPFCNNKVYFEKEPDIEELIEKEEKINYAAELGRNKAKEDYRKVKIKRIVVGIVITIIGLIAFVLIANFFKYTSLIYMEDPFRCVDISFTGNNGSGIIKLKNNNKCDEFNDINYVITKKDNLSLGDDVEIIAESSKYRFNVDSKKYTVKGLSVYLTDFGSLTNVMIDSLHKNSINTLKNHIFGMSYSGEVVSMTPYKLYLLTDNENKNYLYDVYKVSNKTKSGKIYTKYAVAYYKDFVITNNSGLFSYKETSYVGNVIKAGNSNVWNSIDKDYIGNMSGFETITDFENYIVKHNDGTFVKKEK